MPLYSLETFTPVADFDVLGFTLQYEICTSNILTMLDLAKIPLRSTQRTLEHPLVIAGGPCAQNPEPVAPFVEGGMGFANLSVDLHAEIDGVDVSDQADDLLEDEDDDLDATKFLLAFGGGLNARLAEQVRLDIGYRYTRIFTEDPVVNTSTIFAALKFWF